MVDSDNGRPVERDGLRVILKHKKRFSRVAKDLKAKVDGRRNRLAAWKLKVDEQEKKVRRWSEKVERLEALGVDTGELARARLYKVSSAAELDKQKATVEKIIKEINDLEANGLDLTDDIKRDDAAVEALSQGGGAAPEDEAPEDEARALIEKARAFGEKYGVEGLVETIDLGDRSVEVIRMHRARHAKVEPVKGVWPSIFAEPDLSPEEVSARLVRLDALLATAPPEMKRLADMLSTPGMLHMMMIEAATLRGMKLPVSTDPEVLRQGREALVKGLVIDAEVYEKNFKKSQS